MQLTIALNMPEPKSVDKVDHPPSVEDKVRKALDLVDSGYCSDVEWVMINKLYKQLKKMPKKPRITNLINMIDVVLKKYGYHGVSAGDE